MRIGGLLVLTVLFELNLSHYSSAQIVSRKSIHIETPYSDLSRLGKYLYDSLYYDSAINQQEHEFVTFQYKSDSLNVESYLCQSKNLHEKKWPVIFYNRGGTGNYGKLTNEIFPYFYELAREGFIVLGTNYRFVNENGKYDEIGGADVQDVINLIELVKKWPQVDTTNLFMMGLSRGGLMTYSTARKLDFNAVAVVSGVSNSIKQYEYRPIFLEGWNDLSEDENYLGLSNVLPDFEEKKEKYLLDRSPTEWAEEIKSPVLILHSRQDGFVPVSQAFLMAESLENSNASYQLKVYNKKSHALPSWNFDSTEEIITWFKQHLAE